jgi:hypothetical protein
VGGTVALLPLAGFLALISDPLRRHFARFWGLWGGLVMLSLALLFLRAVAAIGSARARRVAVESVAAAFAPAFAAPATAARFEPYGEPPDERSPVWDNPFLWRELRTRAHGSLATVSRWVAGLLVFLVVLMIFVSESFHRRGEVRAILGSLHLMAGCALVLLLSCASIVSEKRDRTLPLLLTTTASMHCYVLAKVVGVLRHAWIPLVAGCLLVASSSIRSVPALGWGAAYLCFGVGAGIHASVRAARPAGALGLGAAIAAGPLLVVAVLAYLRVSDHHLAWLLPFMVSRHSAPLLVSGLGYATAGVVLLLGAAARLRRRYRPDGVA